MKIIFEFFYYCTYRLVLSINGIRDKRELLAANLYYIPLFFISFAIFIPVIIITSLIKVISIPFFISAMIIVLMFFGWKFLCKKYFISKNHSERIIKNWQPKIKNRTAVILGILFFIFYS